MAVDRRVTAFLKQRIGLDAASIGEAAVERAWRQRLVVTGQQAEGYWPHLMASAEEQQSLIEAVVVPESWFFRYPESFAALAALAQERLAARPERPLRLLSAPCASGEEPYSMMMALQDAGLNPSQFSVDAVDISPPLLERARAGVYGRNAFRGDNLSFRSRYFTEVAEGFLLDAAVRAQVRFRPANLLEPLSLGGGPYDFVFCRNVLIYFDVPTQEAVLRTLTGLTAPDGFLFVGPAEASLLSRQGLPPVGLALSFAFRREAAARPPVAVLPHRRSAPPLIRQPRPATVVPAFPRAAVVAPAPKPPAENRLARIAGLADNGRIEEALRLCAEELATAGPSVAVFYWMGLLHDTEGRQAEAIGYYRKALYLEPRHAESLAQLATLLRSCGDETAARRLKARVNRGGSGS